jgi:hypothetical protein
MAKPEERIAFFETVERRFALEARIATARRLAPRKNGRKP